MANESPHRRPVRVLVLTANPLGTGRLSLDEEVRRITKALNRSPGSFEFSIAPAARIEDLQRELLNFEPEYVHFCGHGQGERGIVFQSDTGGIRAISGERLSALFEVFRARLRCVFLNCCFSRVQAEAIVGQIKFVVGTNKAIGDSLAIEFASTFYEALGAGRSIPIAFKFALSVTAGTPDATIPLLLQRATSKKSKTEIPEPFSEPDHFISEKETITLKRWILEDRCNIIFLSPPASLGNLGKKRQGQDRTMCLGSHITSILSLDAHFRRVAREDLGSSAPINEFLAKLLIDLSPNRELDVFRDPKGLVSAIIKNIRKERCLIVLENIDKVLAVDHGVLGYKNGYEDLNHLFRESAELIHESCLLLIGRFAPPGIVEWKRQGMKVQTIKLQMDDQVKKSGTSSEAAFRSSVQVSRRHDHSSAEIKPANPLSERVWRPQESLRSHLSPLVNLLLREREAVVFLGPDSALEGRKSGEPYPTLDCLARRILEDEGRKPEDLKNLRGEFRDVLQRWADEERLSHYLGQYLSGEPGPAHYYLAALALTLAEESNPLLFVTTGFDDLMEEAFSKLQSGEARYKAKVFRLGSNVGDDELRRTLEGISSHLRRSGPVILKLFGDLDADSPLLNRKTKVREPIRTKLQQWFQRLSILIGYGFEDRSLDEFIRSGDTRTPTFVVSGTDASRRIRDGKNIYWMEVPFGVFTLGLLEVLRSRERGLLSRIEILLRRLDPHALYPDKESIVVRAEVSSRVSILRVEERLPRSQSEGTIRSLVPIKRRETAPGIEVFLRSEKPLLAVVGDSGTGKSTLFYHIYKTAEDFISIFYDVHNLQASGSLTRKLADDFLCDESRLESLLAELDKVLRLRSSYLLILVDGLNESLEVKPSTLRFGIEDLAARLPRSIKIAYSCRKVYWDNFIRNIAPIPADLYFGSKEFSLGRYSPEEVEEAFQAYQDLYVFKGTYAALSAEFKQRITDPLMLRMLAEGYQRKELPSFAPAVLIFESYEQRFRQSFAGTVVPEFLTALVVAKANEAETGRPSDQFLVSAIRMDSLLIQLIQQQQTNPHRPGNPLLQLEDEGVLLALDDQKTAYRFAYDRFFEYLLGKALSVQLECGNRKLFLDSLKDQIKKLCPLHFSFIQALKSEIIRLNIENSAGSWSMYDPSVLFSLLNDRDAGIVCFTKDLLRELMFEGKEDLLPVIGAVYSDKSAGQHLMLDIAPDSARILPQVSRGLASGVRDTARRCCHILANAITSLENRKIVEADILSELHRGHLVQPTLIGLIYYTAALFSAADRQALDPFSSIRDFWRRVLDIIGTSEEVTRALAHSLVKVIRDEGGRFFGDYSERAMDYIWDDMPQEVRDLALQLVPLVVDPELEIDRDMHEILLFFGSCIRDWSDRKCPSRLTEGAYKCEYKISQWIFIQRCKNHYWKVKEHLGKFVTTGYSRSIEVALCNMKYCCRVCLRGKVSRPLLEDAYQTMLAWMPDYKRDENSFYWSLSEDDPYSLNECPIGMVGGVAILDEFSPREGPVPFLETWITSLDRRDVLFALLCARSLWREQPAKILRTLDLAVYSEDTTVKLWLEKILKEIYLIHPRLVEDFLWRNGFDAIRIQAIKHRADVVDPSALEHPGDPLYKALFLGPRSRREKFAEWYVRLLKSPSLKSYCEDFVQCVIGGLTSES